MRVPITIYGLELNPQRKKERRFELKAERGCLVMEHVTASCIGIPQIEPSLRVFAVVP